RLELCLGEDALVLEFTQLLQLGQLIARIGRRCGRTARRGLLVSGLLFVGLLLVGLLLLCRPAAGLPARDPVRHGCCRAGNHRGACNPTNESWHGFPPCRLRFAGQRLPRRQWPRAALGPGCARWPPTAHLRAEAPSPAVLPSDSRR